MNIFQNQLFSPVDSSSEDELQDILDLPVAQVPAEIESENETENVKNFDCKLPTYESDKINKHSDSSKSHSSQKIKNIKSKDM
jgi:hypothetical protein